jgi:cobalt-zinc-cadmium efflux system membrane fusion protein
VLDVSPIGLQPGQSVRARIIPRAVAASTLIVVPDEAIQSVEGRDVVFVRTAKGFEARSVTVGQRGAGRAEIVSGLQPGQAIAARSAFLLKAELGKGEGEEH